MGRITRRVVKEEVQINQAAKLDRLNPDRLCIPRDATWFSYLKAKVTGLLSERGDLDAGVVEVRSMAAAPAPPVAPRILRTRA